jgi:hypothetical protein
MIATWKPKEEIGNDALKSSSILSLWILPKAEAIDKKKIVVTSLDILD